jgi:hypothetical protein
VAERHCWRTSAEGPVLCELCKKGGHIADDPARIGCRPLWSDNGPALRKSTISDYYSLIGVLLVALTAGLLVAHVDHNSLNPSSVDMLPINPVLGR